MLRNLVLKWLGLGGVAERVALLQSSVLPVLDALKASIPAGEQAARAALEGVDGAFSRLDAMAARLQQVEDVLNTVQGVMGLKKGTGWIDRAARAMEGDAAVHREGK